MANNYTQFAKTLALDPKDVDWVNAQLEEIDTPDSKHADTGLRFIVEHDADSPAALDAWYQEMPDVAGFEATVCEDHVHIHDDGGGDVDKAVYFIWLYIHNCCNKIALQFSWADTCDKPRSDEFSGGSCFITDTHVIYGSWYECGLLITMWQQADGDVLKFEILRALAAIKASWDAKSRIEKLVDHELSDDHEILLMDLGVADTMDSQTLEDFANELRAKD